MKLLAAQTADRKQHEYQNAGGLFIKRAHRYKVRTGSTRTGRYTLDGVPAWIRLERNITRTLSCGVMIFLVLAVVTIATATEFSILPDRDIQGFDV